MIPEASSVINESSDYVFIDKASEQISFRATSSYINGDRSMKKMRNKIKYISHFLHLYKLFSPHDVTMNIDLKSMIYAHTFTSKYFNDLLNFNLNNKDSNALSVSNPDMFSINGACILLGICVVIHYGKSTAESVIAYL